MWIVLRSLRVICYDRWVLSEGRKNYFKDWCLVNSKSTFLFVTKLNLMKYGHSTYMHGHAVYVTEGLLFAWDLSLENSADSYLCFQLALLHWVSYFFFPYRSPSLSLCTVFYFISSNIDKVLQSTHLLCLSLETLASIIRTGWPILMDFVIICLSQTTLLRWLTFLLRSLTVILTVLPFRFYFFIWCYYLFYIQ